MHICKTAEVEAPPAKLERAGQYSLRQEVLGLWGLTRLAQSFHSGFHKIRNLETLCYYAIEVPTRRKRTPMNVPQMIDDWKGVIVTLCTAHDKNEIDRAEFRMDELLTPMLAAPVKQLREFYVGLTDALKSDARVPFFIWSIFSAWGKAVIAECSDQAKVVRLRKKLAGEIAEMAEENLERKDIVTAMVGALMWRDPSQLEEIKADLEAGAKPRLKGRESCLFLVTRRKGRENMVML